MAKLAGGIPALRRLLVRIALVALAPVGALYWNLTAAELGFVAGSSLFWIALEAAIFYKVRAASPCKNIPFLIRLLCGYGLDIQVAWLPGQDYSPASRPEYGSLLDNMTHAFFDAQTHLSKNGSSIAEGSDPVPTYVATLSVVLPCANEGEFPAKTIRSIFEATPSDQLEEIIVIDDASRPPIASQITGEYLNTYRARIIRHARQEGLIRSKKDGGDAAKGDAVVFLDCHVKPMKGWTGPILSNLRENPRRIVVPAITALDPDSWEEISPYGGGTKMCMTWDADFFWCNEYPGPNVPIMSGGLLAMTKFWWNSIGGYDSEMRAWGGENLDQSLRTWLCGGEIRVAEGSRVAHMWRDPKKPKTMLRYSIPTDDVRRNRLRAATAWFDGWAEKVRGFPQFDDFREGGRLSIGSLENIEYYRKKLKCKSFDWYLNKFKDFYLETGRLPDSVYNLRERSSGLCLSHRFAAGKPAGFTLTPCSMGSELQRFHEANLGAGKRCCSGIKAWDFDSCLQAWGKGKELGTGMCDNFGYGDGQKFRLTTKGSLEWKYGRGCVVPESRGAAPGPRRAAIFRTRACPTHLEHLGGQRLRIVSGSLCLVAAQHGEGALAFVPCAGAGVEEQVFESVKGADAVHYQLKSSTGLCIQNVGGTPIALPCKPDEDSKQVFKADSSEAKYSGPIQMMDEYGTLVHLCATPPPMQAVRLADCAAEGSKAKPGQGFARYHEKADGSFLLRDEQLDVCLKADSTSGQNTLVSAECPPDDEHGWRWRYDKTGGRLSHVAQNLCVDANDYKTLILYPCYPPGQNNKQKYNFRDNGLVEMPRSWADNGRLRYPAQCLDSDPIEPVKLTVADCSTAGQSGVAWERVWSEVPLETQLWRKAASKYGFLSRYQ